MLNSRFTAVRVRPANRNLPRNDDGTLPACWLLVEWPSNADAPTDYWLSTLPEDTPIETVVVAKISQKRRAEKTSSEPHSSEIQEAASTFDSAIERWLAASTQAALTEEIVNDLDVAYADYIEVTASVPSAPDDLSTQRQDFYARFAAYTVKVTKVNGVNFERLEEPSNVVDLAPYIACQQELFARQIES